jgi:drug/metabolite transporter (DMT)-like permease
VSNRKLLAHLSVLTANLIYGANYSVAKTIMPELIKPFGFIFIRVIVTVILFWIAGYFIKAKKVAANDLPRLFLCGIFGVALNQLLFFKGLDLTSPINASLMMTTNPIMVLLVAAALVNEKITLLKIAGIITGVAGAGFLILYGNTVQMTSGSVAGDIMVLVNSLSFGLFLIIVKPLMQKYSTLTVMKWVFLFGSIAVFPFGYSEFTVIDWKQFNFNDWWALAYVVLAVTSIAYMLNVYALKNLSSSSVSAYIYLQPLFAAFFAIIAGQDKLTLLHVTSAVLIFVGVYMVNAGGFKRAAGKLTSAKKS